MYKTPAIGTKGIFPVIPPFTLSREKVYSVEGYRTWADYLSDTEDPFALVYEPQGVSEEVYRIDSADPNIIMLVLVTDDGERAVIPNKYLENYPNTNVVPHDWVVATISLGILPNTYDLQRVRDAITQSVSDYTGVESNVYFAKQQTNRAITQAEALQLEQIRNAAIQNRTTAYAEKAALLNTIAMLQNQVNDLLSVIENQP